MKIRFVKMLEEFQVGDLVRDFGTKRVGIILKHNGRYECVKVFWSCGEDRICTLSKFWLVVLARGKDNEI